MAEFNWSLPYPSRREAVLASNIVATSQPLSAQAGLQIMKQGGNAIDAAVATAAMMTVVEPTSNGLGSDAFALVWAGGELHGLNASGRSPAALRPEQFAGNDALDFVGWDGVTVPGAISAWVALSNRFGSLPFEQLLQPAIDYARSGYLVARQTAESWARAPERYGALQPFMDTFYPNGRGPRPGERVVLADHAVTLESIAATAGESFYRGDVADRIVAHSEASGGLFTASDLASHEPEWVRPIAVDYRAYTLHEIPPNGQGLVALIALGILGHHDVAKHDVDSPDSLHLQIEAMKLAFADGHRYVADPEWMDRTVDDLLDDRYLAQRASMIDMNKARDPKFGEPKQGGTIYLTTADADGNMVSYIQSNYTGFGSGVVVPGTGISLQNRGCGFTLEEGHPNRAAGGKRPYHTIIPGFVTLGGAPVMSFGVMGGFMQPQGHAQMMVRLADYQQNPQAALDAPRFQIFNGLNVGIESGYSPGVYEELQRRGHDVEIVHERTVKYGGGQAIHRLEDGYFGASDLRRDGQAVGF